MQVPVHPLFLMLRLLMLYALCVPYAVGLAVQWLHALHVVAHCIFFGVGCE